MPVTDGGRAGEDMDVPGIGQVLRLGPHPVELARAGDRALGEIGNAAEARILVRNDDARPCRICSLRRGEARNAGTLIELALAEDLNTTYPAVRLQVPPGRLVLASANPFRDGAAVELATAETGRVVVALYDALGRRLAVLFDGTLAAGSPRRIAVDGRALAPGAYVVRMEAAGRTFTRRVTVIR